MKFAAHRENKVSLRRPKAGQECILRLHRSHCMQNSNKFRPYDEEEEALIVHCIYMCFWSFTSIISSKQLAHSGTKKLKVASGERASCGG